MQIGSLEIVRATPEMAEALTDLALASKRHWVYPEAWLVAWTDTLRITPALIRVNEIQVAILAGKLVGFYGLSFENFTAHLDHLWIEPAYIGQGIGRCLFAHA